MMLQPLLQRICFSTHILLSVGKVFLQFPRFPALGDHHLLFHFRHIESCTYYNAMQFLEIGG